MPVHRRIQVGIRQMRSHGLGGLHSETLAKEPDVEGIQGVEDGREFGDEGTEFLDGEQIVLDRPSP